jgi:hypothetical protein
VKLHTRALGVCAALALCGTAAQADPTAADIAAFATEDLSAREALTKIVARRDNPKLFIAHQGCLKALRRPNDWGTPACQMIEDQWATLYSHDVDLLIAGADAYQAAHRPEPMPWPKDCATPGPQNAEAAALHQLCEAEKKDAAKAASH